LPALEPELHEALATLEAHPKSSAVASRRLVETALGVLFEEVNGKRPGTRAIEGFLRDQTFNGSLDDAIVPWIRTVQNLGNPNAHGSLGVQDAEVSARSARATLEAACEVLEWVHRGHVSRRRGASPIDYLLVPHRGESAPQPQVLSGSGTQRGDKGGPPGDGMGSRPLTGIFIAIFLLAIFAVLGWFLINDGQKRVAAADLFSPTGKLGDVGDVTISQTADHVELRYVPQGAGPHESEHKYVNGRLNPEPARFGGIGWLAGARDEAPGQDLSKFRTLSWEARADRPLNVHFDLGGGIWKWNDDEVATSRAVPRMVPRVHADSLRKRSLVKRLTTEWQTFAYDLSQIDRAELEHVVMGFSCVVSWEDNDLRGPSDTVITVRVRNLRYLP
jgi:hypothetical protein